MANAAHDWDPRGTKARLLHAGATLLDETLRDGLQSPSAIDPPLEAKIAILHRIDALGIHVVNLGLPASSARSLRDVRALAAEIGRARLRVAACAAARTLESDLAPIADVAQATGVPIEAYAFIGSSAMRALAEAWDEAEVRRKSGEAIAFAVRHGLQVCFVGEDTTRTHPERLRALFASAIDHGASAICLADTVGHATPDGVRALVDFVQRAVGDDGVRIDWHGHDDRGFALANALAALRAGVGRVHATALGIGERAGNVSMDMLLLNLARRGEVAVSEAAIGAYADEVARATGWPRRPARALAAE